jgi:hypothetical protein
MLGSEILLRAMSKVSGNVAFFELYSVVIFQGQVDRIRAARSERTDNPPDALVPTTLASNPAC